MYRLVPITTALVLALAAPTAVLADPGHGNGGGNGKGGDRQEHGNRGGGDDHGPGNGNANGNGRGDDHGARGHDGPGHGQAEPRHDQRADARVLVGPGGGVVVVQDDRGRRGRDDAREIRRELERQAFQTRDGRPVVYFARENDRGLIAGCPPGLAKKNNGCLPPGQARQIARAAEAARYDWLWRTRGDDWNYRYDDGYLYRMDRQGSLLGWLPVLGGALSPGSVWPTQYQYQPAPDYYSSYFGLPANQQYRYADGALYGVDPQTQMISQVAALLTGQNLSVGQALPAGYDVYNVPYGYRDQYADNANAMYRYNDGYVYQADPKTQLITAVIQLLT